jgi:DNA repair exonuclease SbcCD nuclease subunit
MTRRLKFLQLSDVHLDSIVAGGRLQLPRARAAERRKEIRDVFAAAMELATEHRVDVILLPGDLFDDESVSDDTVNFVVDVFRREPRIPVVLAPGNHDPYSLTSPYCGTFRARRGQPPWPQHVRIVQEPRFVSFRHAGVPGVSFTAMGYDHNRSIDERLLASPLPREEEPLQLLLFHGSRERFAPPGKMVTLPFSDDELIAQGFDYGAIGHYHSYQAIESRGRIVACYSGCPAGRGIAEAGKKVVLLGEVIRDDGVVRVEVEPQRLDRREVGQVKISVQGATHRDALLQRLEHGLAASGYTREDLLLVEVHGRLPRGIDTSLPPDFLADRYFHVAFDTTGLKPDYDLGVYLGSGIRSTEGRFVKEITSLMEEERDTERRRILENALYYGLDALIQKEVVPRYED